MCATGNLNTSCYSIWSRWHIPQVLEYDLHLFLIPFYLFVCFVEGVCVFVMKLNARSILSAYRIFTTASIVFFYVPSTRKPRVFFLICFVFVLYYFSFSLSCYSCLEIHLLRVCYTVLLTSNFFVAEKSWSASFINFLIRRHTRVPIISSASLRIFFLQNINLCCLWNMIFRMRNENRLPREQSRKL